MVADILRPIDHEFDDPARHQRRIFRRVPPGLIRIKPRDPLEEFSREILPANILHRVGELVDAQIDGVDGALTFGKQAEIVI